MLSNILSNKDKSVRGLENATKISKTNKFLGIVLVFLIVVVIALSLFSINSKSATLSDLQKKVDTIEITRLGETNILILQDDKWADAVHNNQIIKQEYVLDVFTTLDRMIVDDVISNNPEKQSVYQVDDSGTHVVMKSGDRIITSFVVGKNGPSWPSSYLRIEDSNDVYLVREMLSQIFGWSDWRNKTIMQLNSDLIQGLKWSNGLEIIQEEGEWKSILPKELVVEETKIQTVFDNLSNLEAIDIADIEVWNLNQQDADFVLEIYSNDNTSSKLAFWNHPKDEGDYDYYVVREGDDSVYVLSKYVAENMEKKIEFLED
jgi:Domain of unknown function (DUF4340)